MSRLFILLVTLFTLTGCDRHKFPTRAQLIENVAHHPGYAFCFRCGQTWDIAKPHMTAYDFETNGLPLHGCFPLCEPCWKAVTNPQDRLVYYQAMYDNWSRLGLKPWQKWEPIKAAVMAGK